jgi:hypothetical protein
VVHNSPMRNRPKRAIHLLDVENLLANPRPAPKEVERCRAQYEALVRPGPSDQVVLSCNHGAAISVGPAWSNARLLLRSGADGADLVLLEVIEREALETRFDEVIIGSGDGIFTDAAARLVAHGPRVTIVSRPESLSRRLRLAASGVIIFSSLPPAPFPLGAAREVA